MNTTDPLREAVSALLEALENAGANPAHHRLTMQRHRQEWPTLWAAIYQVLGAAHLPNERPCGATDGGSTAFVCNLPAGHEGNHKDSHSTGAGSVSWPNRTDADWEALVLEQQQRAERAEGRADQAEAVVARMRAALGTIYIRANAAHWREGQEMRTLADIFYISRGAMNDH